MEIHGERVTIEDVHAPHNLKVGDKVKPKIGPHKGQTHDVIYVHPDGRVAIRPSHPIKRSRVSYRLGAVNAQPHHLDLVDDPKNARNVVHRYAPYLEEHSDLFRMTQQLVREANEKEEKKDSEKKDTEDKDSEESSKKEKKPEEKKSGKIELSAKKDVFNAEPTTTPNVWQQT